MPLTSRRITMNELPTQSDRQSDLTEEQRHSIINARVTKVIDNMTTKDIIEAYAENLFDWYETWDDNELRDLL